MRYSPTHLTTQHLLDTEWALTKHLLNEEMSLATPDSSRNGRYEDHLKQREDRGTAALGERASLCLGSRPPWAFLDAGADQRGRAAEVLLFVFS